MRKPCRCNSCASLRVLLHVQRKGDSGSPRVVGPTNAYRAWKSWGSAKGFRPPPLLRILPPSSAFPAPLFNSRIPAWIVLRDRPLACAPSDTPPCGNACASAAVQSRRCRSSSTLRNAWYFLRIPPTSSFCPMRKAYHIYLICSSYLCAVPNCPFTANEVSAWWLCFDSLTSIDKELRGIDSLLSDLGRPSLGARGVAFIDAPQRLAEVIQTDGWTPVDTRIRVTDVAKLARTLGGEQLYGQDKTVPLRELIQNASDAIRARQILEERTADWGAICIRFGLDTDGHWVEVEDNGIGMSKAVMTGPLLDFGASCWESELMRRELPGLLARGFEPTGRCGIGFFSVFILGSCVQITSRRYDDSQQGTNVLEFGVDPDSRPIFRRANQEEFIREGGTRVRVWLKEPPAGKRGLAFPLGGIFTGDDATFL